jgi:hypothetical protein
MVTKTYPPAPQRPHCMILVTSKLIEAGRNQGLVLNKDKDVVDWCGYCEDWALEFNPAYVVLLHTLP